MEKGIITGDRRLSVDKWARNSGIPADFARALEKALKEPEQAPYLLDKLTDIFSGARRNCKKEIRNALLRVQIYCSINSDSDPIRVSKQLFMAEVLEKLLFGNNLLMMEEIEQPLKHIRKAKKKIRAGRRNANPAEK